MCFSIRALFCPKGGFLLKIIDFNFSLYEGHIETVLETFDHAVTVLFFFATFLLLY